MVKDTNKFNFFIPAEFVKGGKGGNEMYIKGIASSEVEDSDGETLVPAGYDLSPLLATGFLNYNHQGAKDPDAIIGQPTRAEIINNGKDLYIEGFLYPDSTAAQKTYKLAQVLEKNSPDRRMGFSIEGKALEKDPLNPKRITKARITGVAITPCPKNPNTLLSIMKGEYTEPFVEEDEDVKREKAMTAAGGEGVTQTEDIDGGKKVFEKLLEDKDLPKNANLKKSEVYSLIISRYSDYFKNDIEKAKQIFDLVKEFNTKLYGMENTNGEILSKALDSAFSFIDEKIDEIQKSQSSEDNDLENDNDSEDKKDDEKKEDDKDKVEKSENAEDFEKGAKEEFQIVETPVPNAKYGGVETYLRTVIKEAFEKGMSAEAIVADLISKGCDEDFSSNLVKSVEDEMSKLHANGGIAADGLETSKVEEPVSTHSSKSPSNPFAKSEDAELLKGEIIQTIEATQSRLVEGIEQRFNSLATILKSYSSEINSLKEVSKGLKEENTNLKKSLADANNRIENFASTPQRARSVTSSRQIERFADSELQKSESGKTIYSMRDRNQVRELTAKLTQEFETRIQKGESNKPLENAILELSFAGEMNPESIRGIQPILSDLKIDITR